MTQWRIHRGEILDLSADGLICSANVQLNLSGGVGGAILLRYGNAMQTFLHQVLRDRRVKHLPPGECVISPPFGMPYRAVAHAIAIDGFYETTISLIVQTYENALNQLAAQGCKSIVAACLGCGYGKFPPTEFAMVVNKLQSKSIEGIDQVLLVTTNTDLSEVLQGISNE